MSSDGWGSSFTPKPEWLADVANIKIDNTWPKPVVPHSFTPDYSELTHEQIAHADPELIELYANSRPAEQLEAYQTNAVYSGIVFTKVSIEDGALKVEHVPNDKVYSNVPPTHDPYTNPNAQLYYSCGCGAILDPGTKRFAELNNHASKAGWKIRFSDAGYTPYCVECGKGVE